MIGDVAVDVVLDDRRVVALRQRQQPLFVGVGHDVAQRIVAVGRQQDGLDRPLFQRHLQRRRLTPVSGSVGISSALIPVPFSVCMVPWKQGESTATMSPGWQTARSPAEIASAAGGDQQLVGADLAAGIQQQAGNLFAQRGAP